MADTNWGLAANGATATARYTAGGYSPDSAIDGNDSTAWRCRVYGSQEWLTVDLGRARAVSQIRVKCQASSHFVEEPVVYYSTNGTDFLTTNLTFNDVGDVTHTLTPITARYWRVFKQTIDIWWDVYSFELWGPILAPVPIGPEECPDVSAWLDGLEANVVPCVQAWLDAQ